MWNPDETNTAYGLWNVETYPALLPLPWQTTDTSIENNQWITFEERDEYEPLLDSNYEEVIWEWLDTFCNGVILVKVR